MFNGRDWREAPETAERTFQVLPVVLDLHRLLWFLTEAMDRVPAESDRAELRQAMDDTEMMTRSHPDELSWGEVDRHGRAVHILLQQVSRTVRAEARLRPGTGAPGRADFRGADLRGADKAGQDLRNADLRGADLMDTDFRDANLAGADLTGAIFLVQAQLNSAKGSASTRLSVPLVRPTQWTAPPAR